MRHRFPLRLLGGLTAQAVTLALAVEPAPAQLAPPTTGGVVARAQELRMLGHYKRVLMIGAHPDDEDTELLTVLVRGMGAEAAYLSLNRGEGGQNAIGAELGEALGLLRTEELLAARTLDGARQYFTRAHDFGYSKSLDETWRHWSRDSILKDVVRIVRRFRPQIVVSIFSGTPRDGHGQHQAAGWAAREAFRIAGDSARFPELAAEEGLGPWQPLKLYRSTRFDTAATTLVLPGGVLDTIVGLSFHQIAMASRSLHRSQDMGQLQTIGPSPVRLALVEDRTGRGGGDLWAGIDTTLAAMPGAAARGGGAIWDSIAAAFAGHRRTGAPALPTILDRFAGALAGRGAPGLAGVGRATPEQWDQLTRLQRVIQRSSGVLCDALADDGRIVPGQVITVTLTCWNAGDRPAVVPLVSVRSALARSVRGQADSGATIAPGGTATWTLTIPTPHAAALTQPYFLARPRAGDLYRWPDGPSALLGLPFGDPLLVAEFGQDAEPREVTFRIRHPTLGEVRRPLMIVPRVDVKLDPDTLLWPVGAPGARRFAVTLQHGARDTTTGLVRLELPAGWPAVPPQRFTLTREDETRSFVFEVHAPPGLRGGTVTIGAVAEEEAKVATARRRAGAALGSGADVLGYRDGVFIVDYPHIRPRAYTRSAVATVRLAPLALPELARVGYVRGAADRVPEALRSVGVPLTMLDAAALERGDLSRYDAIVIGSRAYETEPALGQNNARLLAYVRRGGLLIVQYQQHDFFANGYAPYRMTVGGRPLRLDDPASRAPAGGAKQDPERPVSHDRVTDENAPVIPVREDDPVWQVPNRLTADDWRGWVQERGLYFARTWDSAYRTVLRMHDPGEPPLEGGLLIARVGQGTYVYTGLSFFRQLPAGVPGAYRLFANLLALGSRSGRGRADG